MKKPPTPSRTIRRLRCAVYTRKSSEEGLDMEFNSLDAQREACEAYVASQKPEGWMLVPDRYDDGGFSGGTLERPALRRLLADIEAGRVDVIVVYKIDRLSRSLMDFAKLVEVFDRKGVTFVSVTQSFNTTTSMGRLTLNILLSFAQFEREVIGERIRDKFAASRKKGMWMGGWAPLGYDIKDRKLVVNEAEAVLVRRIFERFARRGSVSLLVGLLFDASGDRMTPSHAVKGNTRYRYYVSRPLLTDGAKAGMRGQRIPAVSLETLVTRRIRDWLRDGAAVLDAIRHPVPDGIAQQRIVGGAARLAAAWQDQPPDEVRAVLLSICRRVQVHADRVELTIDELALVRRFESPTAAADGTTANALSEAEALPFVLTIPARLRRAGIEMRMVVDDGSDPAAVDVGLVRTLVRAFAIRDQLFKDHSLSLNDLAEREGIVPSYATRLFRLAFLSPDIVAAILDGRHPPELTVRRLLDDTRLPLEWSEQRAKLGFA